jgi:hypothetical protein
MAKRKPKADVTQVAKFLVDAVTGEQPELAPMPEPVPDSGKNPAAVALGRLGGLKGGKARAAKLSPAKRKAIAKKAATKRWANRPNP